MPRHLPSLWSGLGGHDFFFYGPLPFWIAAVISVVSGGADLGMQLALLGAVLLLLASWTCYLFLRALFPPWPAMLGAVGYALLPYHLWIDWFYRQALGEFAAYIFLPLIALGFEHLRQGRPGGPILAAGVAGMGLCHLPSVLLSAHLFAILTILLLCGAIPRDITRISFALRAAAWAVLGGLLSAFYWLPALTLIDTVSSAQLYTPYFQADAWLLGPGVAQPSSSMVQILLTGFGATLPVLLASLIVVPRQFRFWIVVPVIVVIIANMAFTAPIWRHWVIGQVQFPWRTMIFVDLSLAVAVAALLQRAIQSRHTWRIALVTLLFAYPVTQFASFLVLTKDSQRLSPAVLHRAGAIEYLSPEMLAVLQRRLELSTINHRNQNDVAAEIAEIAASHPVQEIRDKLAVGPRQISFSAPPGDNQIMVPLQYWEFWSAKDSNGMLLEVKPNMRFGTMDVVAPVGGFDGSKITLELPRQPSERQGIALSLAGLVIVLIYLTRMWPSARRRRA